MKTVVYVLTLILITKYETLKISFFIRYVYSF